MPLFVIFMRFSRCLYQNVSLKYLRNYRLSVPKEKLYRALVISNLIAVHEKTGIGRLSAYCGAVSAGCAAGCGIAYLQDGGYNEIAHTLVNSLAIVSGIICDGAKPSCAAKIAASVEAGILGYHMYMNHLFHSLLLLIVIDYLSYALLVIFQYRQNHLFYN